MVTLFFLIHFIPISFNISPFEKHLPDIFMVIQMCNCGEDVTEIEVKPDGSWRAKNETEYRDLMQWHKPDGSLIVVESDVDMKLNQQSLKQIKQEAASDAHIPLKIGIKRNRDGIWEVSKPEDMRTLSSSENGHKVLNSSATGSYRDGEDTSVNQDQFDLSINNGHELESMSLNFDATYNTANQVPSAPAMEPHVIVLSDSEEDNVQLISPEHVYDAGHVEATGMSFPIHPNGTSDPYADSSLPTNGNSCLGLFNSNSDDFGMPLWPPMPQNGPGFQFFSDTDVHHALIDEQHDSNLQMNDYGLINSALNSASQAGLQSQACHPNDDIMVDNPMALVGDDPALRMFLPTRPGTARTDLRNPTDISNDGRTEDWISLRLGGGGGDQNTLPGNDANLRNQFPSKEECMDSLDDTGKFSDQILDESSFIFSSRIIVNMIIILNMITHLSWFQLYTFLVVPSFNIFCVLSFFSI